MLEITGVTVQSLRDLYDVFRRDVLQKPLILILDDIDGETIGLGCVPRKW